MSTASALPRVQGRHQNRALAAARRPRAIELITEGMSYQQVADELGYASKGTVHRLVHQALARQTREAVQELQQLKAERLDALQASLWAGAMAGDVDAAREVVRIVMARSRLLGLFGQKPMEPWQPRTVVLTGEDRAALGL